MTETTNQPAQVQQPVFKMPSKQALHQHLNKTERLVAEVALQSAGYGGLKVDGDFDPTTVNALQKWQADNGYRADAILTRDQFMQLRNR